MNRKMDLDLNSPMIERQNSRLIVDQADFD